MTTERRDAPEHFAAIGWQLINDLKPTDNPKPEENPMTHTTQPLDLEPIRRALANYQADPDVQDAELAIDLAADVPALLAEVERLRAANETLLNHLGDAADKLLALGWDDVAAQMENGTYRPANLA